MAKAALAIDPQAPVKVKLTGDLDEDILRVAAIRAARPRAWIGVDANQGYDRRTLEALLPLLVEQGVAQPEQPLRRGAAADPDRSEEHTSELKSLMSQSYDVFCLKENCTHQN